MRDFSWRLELQALLEGVLLGVGGSWRLYESVFAYVVLGSLSLMLWTESKGQIYFGLTEPHLQKILHGQQAVKSISYTLLHISGVILDI